MTAFVGRPLWVLTTGIGRGAQMAVILDGMANRLKSSLTGHKVAKPFDRRSANVLVCMSVSSRRRGSHGK
jgi:hypothetical protein